MTATKFQSTVDEETPLFSSLFRVLDTKVDVELGSSSAINSTATPTAASTAMTRSGSRSSKSVNMRRVSSLLMDDEVKS